MKALLSDQTPPGGVGGYGGPIQSTPFHRRQLLLDRLMQDLGIERVDVSTGTVTKRIPATTRRKDAETQPPQGIALVRVSGPLAGLALAAPQLKEHDGAHEIGPVQQGNRIINFQQ